MSWLARSQFFLAPQWLMVVGVAPLLLLVGCGRGDGPEIARAQGVVRLNGTPLPEATVRFTPADNTGTYSIGTTDDQGRFDLRFTRQSKGAIVGKHLVSITTGNPNNEDEDGNPQPIPEILPAIYHKESTLSEEVGRGKNHFEYDLVSQKETGKGKKKRK